MLSLPVRAHLCVASTAAAEERGRAIVFVSGEGGAWQHGMSHISPPSLSVFRCVSSAFLHPGFYVLHNCVLVAVLQQICSDTVPSRRGRGHRGGQVEKETG